MELLAVLAVAALIAALLLWRGRDPLVLEAAQSVGRNVGQLQSELARLARAQEELRRELQRGRESSLRELAEAAQGIRGEIGQAQRALAEVKALEQGRARQTERTAESLRRVEAVLAGSPARGAAGENILARALAQLPPDLICVNVAFGSKVVEYALSLPGGRLLPIDSKWTSAAAVERLAEAEDPLERRRLAEQVVREVRSRIREMAKYLDPVRTLSIGLLAVPDAVCVAAPEAQAEGYREGVLVVPYSLALPYVLTLYRLALRFGTAVDADQLASRLRGLDEALRRIDEEVEGRMSRSLVQLQNARDALRDELAEARRSTSRLLEAAVPEPALSAGPAGAGEPD